MKAITVFELYDLLKEGFVSRWTPDGQPLSECWSNYVLQIIGKDIPIPSSAIAILKSFEVVSRYRDTQLQVFANFPEFWQNKGQWVLNLGD